MRLKQPQLVGNWDFVMEDPEGNEVIVPPAPMQGLNSLAAITDMVLSYMGVYDGVTDQAYSKLAHERAEALGIDIRAYMIRVIQHQMCIRKASQGVECWSDGAGDDLHSVLTKVEGFVRAVVPAVVRETMERGIMRITPNNSKTFAGCSSCGGGAVFKPNQDALGRAGKLNQL